MIGKHVALLVIAGVSCGPRAEPEPPTRAPPGVSRREDDVRPRAAARWPRYLVGEVCFTAAIRGEYYVPLFAVGERGWTADESVARAPLTEAPQHFNVLGFDGERHGDMFTAPDGWRAEARGFVGEYRGVMSVGPCSFVRPDGRRVIDMGCGNAGGCGIAVAVAGRTRVPPTPPAVEREVLRLCVTGGTLIGDLDIDGVEESFAIDAFGTQEVIQGVPHDGASCSGSPASRFAWYGVQLGADVVDVLGAVDLDQDGAIELMIAFTAAGGQRKVALYAPASPAPRLVRRAVVPR